MNNGQRADAPYQTLEKMMPKEFGFIGQGLLVMEMLLGFFCLPVEALLHRSFGQRYMTPLCLFLLGGSLGFLTLVEVNAARDTSAKTAVLFSPLRLVLLVCVALFVKHLYDIWKSCRAGEHIHTRYSGTPYAFWRRVIAPLSRVMTVDEFLVKRLAEPVAVTLLGLVVLALNRQLGFFFLLSGVMLAIKTQLEYVRLRTRILDMLDGIVEGQSIRRYVQPGKNADQTPGFALPVPAAARPILRAALFAPSMTDAFGGLSKELQELMGVKNGRPHRIRTTCPHCGKSGTIPEEAEGQKVRCTGCRTLFETHVMEEVTSE